MAASASSREEFGLGGNSRADRRGLTAAGCRRHLKASLPYTWRTAMLETDQEAGPNLYKARAGGGASFISVVRLSGKWPCDSEETRKLSILQAPYSILGTCFLLLTAHRDIEAVKKHQEHSKDHNGKRQ